MEITRSPLWADVLNQVQTSVIDGTYVPCMMDYAYTSVTCLNGRCIMQLQVFLCDILGILVHHTHFPPRLLLRCIHCAQQSVKSNWFQGNLPLNLPLLVSIALITFKPSQHLLHVVDLLGSNTDTGRHIVSNTNSLHWSGAPRQHLFSLLWKTNSKAALPDAAPPLRGC